MRKDYPPTMAAAGQSTPVAIHARMAARLIDWCRDGQTLEHAAYTLRRPYGSLHRRYSGESDWSLADFIHAAAAQIASGTSCDLLASLTHDLLGAPAGEAIEVERLLSQEIADNAQAIGTDNSILADGKADPSELRRKLLELDRQSARKQRLRAVILAQLEKLDGGAA